MSTWMDEQKRVAVAHALVVLMGLYHACKGREFLLNPQILLARSPPPELEISLDASSH